MAKNPGDGGIAKWLALMVACIVGLASTGMATAQSYPAHPITIIVPFAAGGPTDTLARILAQRMTVKLGQGVVVENVSGASGSLGVGRVVRASPDGYTLSIGNVTTHVFNGAIYPLPYDLLKDFEPIAMVASNPQVLLGKREIPATTLQELIAWIKARPGAVLIGTTGNGSSVHISGVYLAKTLGIPATMVPYRGAAPALQALMAGQIDILFDQESNALPQVRAKTVKAYAVTAKNPSAAAPDIATVDAAGLPGFYMAVWHGVWPLNRYTTSCAPPGVRLAHCEWRSVLKRRMPASLSRARQISAVLACKNRRKPRFILASQTPLSSSTGIRWRLIFLLKAEPS
jgi:tripartite-type tricarboxylate transporter receptor subunit TctC